MKVFDRLWNWIDSRAHISDIPLKGMPDYAMNISYWTGGLLAAAFIYQAITGMLLLLYYQGTPTAAYSSTLFIMNKVPFGEILLTSHQYMAYAMIFLVFVHFFRNYFLGAYKKPRELAWIVGVFMSLVTILLGYTGYFLPYTQISVFATNIGANMAGVVPLIGNFLSSLLVGNGTMTDRFIRFLDYHTLILPALLILLLGLHMYLFEKNETAPPLHEDNKEHKLFKWFPTYFIYTVAITLLVWGAVLVLSGLFPLPVFPAYGSGAIITPLPEWYLMPEYKFLDFDGITPIIEIAALTLLIIFLIIVPFLDRSESRDPRDRPVFTAIGTTNLSLLILLTAWGYEQPAIPIPVLEWAPVMVLIVAVNFGLTLLMYRRYRGSQK